jgi:hypothetical protein
MNAKSRFLLISVVSTAVMFGAGGSAPVRGDTYLEYLKVKASWRFLSLYGDYTWSEEDAPINRAYKRYRDQQEKKNVLAIGTVTVNGSYPTVLYDANDIGTIETLGFFFIDPNTGLQTSGPAVTSVRYEVSEHPDTDQIEGGDRVPTFSHLGTSYDSLSNFSFSYTISSSSFEPIIQAIPCFDGQPIEIPGAGGENVAMASTINLLVPEPSTLFLFIIGMLGLANYGCRCKR